MRPFQAAATSVSGKMLTVHDKIQTQLSLAIYKSRSMGVWRLQQDIVTQDVFCSSGAHTGVTAYKTRADTYS